MLKISPHTFDNFLIWCTPRQNQPSNWVTHTHTIVVHFSYLYIYTAWFDDIYIHTQQKGLTIIISTMFLLVIMLHHTHTHKLCDVSRNQTTVPLPYTEHRIFASFTSSFFSPQSFLMSIFCNSPRFSLTFLWISLRQDEICTKIVHLALCWSL